MVFPPLRVWDTEHNNGVLIYLLFAERDVEIVADRGFNTRVSAAQWKPFVAPWKRALAKENSRQGSPKAST